MANRPARAINDTDRRRIFRTLETHARAGSMSAIRTLAIVQLTADTGLRLSELLRLDCSQIIEDTSATRPRIVSSFYLEPKQAKGRRGSAKAKAYTSAGQIQIPKRSRAALLAYLRALRARGWLRTWRGSPWITCKAGPTGGASSHHPVKQRAVQLLWSEWQRRAGIRAPYRWHDLRHTAITRWSRTPGADVFSVAELARHRNVRTTQRYVHADPVRLAAIAEQASEL